jgi:hypothetical protein
MHHNTSCCKGVLHTTASISRNAPRHMSYNRTQVLTQVTQAKQPAKQPT